MILSPPMKHRTRCALFVFALALFFTHCNPSTDRRIDSVNPKIGIAGEDLEITIRGKDFDIALHRDVSCSGKRTVYADDEFSVTLIHEDNDSEHSFSNVEWKSRTEIYGESPPDVCLGA